MAFMLAQGEVLALPLPHVARHGWFINIMVVTCTYLTVRPSQLPREISEVILRQTLGKSISILDQERTRGE